MCAHAEESRTLTCDEIGSIYGKPPLAFDCSIQNTPVKLSKSKDYYDPFFLVQGKLCIYQVASSKHSFRFLWAESSGGTDFVDYFGDHEPLTSPDKERKTDNNLKLSRSASLVIVPNFGSQNFWGYDLDLDLNTMNATLDVTHAPKGTLFGADRDHLSLNCIQK